MGGGGEADPQQPKGLMAEQQVLPKTEEGVHVF